MKKNAVCRQLMIPILAILFLAPAAPLFSQSVLWKITDGSARVSYIYGTIHLTDPRVFEWDDSIYRRIGQCSLYVGELDLSPANLLKASALMILPGEETLKEKFSPADYEIIRTGLKTCSGYDIGFFNRLKPPALMGLCYASGEGERLDATVDELLFQYARSKGLTVKGLETIEEQVALFDHIPDAYVVDFFRHIDQNNSETEQMIDLYCRGDLDSLYNLMQEEETDALMNKEIITDRNYRMAERLEPLLREQSVFIAVGAGHLPGNVGIIALLRKEGFTIQPIFIHHTTHTSIQKIVVE
jgi:uncharacterized protein